MKEGLGIKHMFTLNKALLRKWCWKFALERDLPWRKDIVGKFGEEPDKWCSWVGRKVMTLACGRW